MDDLRSLRHFEAVYRLLSFSAAAAELRLTHSTITKSIKTLEADWGIQLFHRTTRSVVATEAGRRLYPQAVELLAFAGGVRKSASAGMQELIVLCGVGAIDGMIYPAVKNFGKRYPETRISIVTLQPHLAAEELRQQRAHILVYHQTSFAVMPHRERMHVTKVIDEPYWIIHRHGAPIASQSHSLENLMRDYDWALPVGPTFEDSLPKGLRNLVIECSVPRYRLSSQAACIELVKHSDLITILPQSLANDLMEKGEVAAIPLPGEFRFAVGAAVLKDVGNETILEHFIECLQAS